MAVGSLVEEEWMRQELGTIKYLHPEFPPLEVPHTQKSGKPLWGSTVAPGARLALAVLEQAIRDIQNMPAVLPEMDDFRDTCSQQIAEVRRHRLRRAFRDGEDALRWVFDESPTSLPHASFMHVCTALDLDPEGLRNKIRDNVDNMPMPTRGSGRHPVSSSMR